MRFDIITIFPKIFDSYLNESLVKRAREMRIIEIVTHNLRNHSKDKHKKVDNRPYGGGPGMVFSVEPIYGAVSSIENKISRKRNSKSRVILFSTRGKKLDAKAARRLSKYSGLILICGRYEGVDERVAKCIADEEISIGDYVLNGGEVAAMVLIETVSRFVPGFLGKAESLEEIKGSYTAYTRPAEFVPDAKSRNKYFPKSPLKWTVPKTLLSGHHKKIKEHRKIS
ncbi:MAG: tRNA (guanosine(37)-N1)-methyltransferase TrmD [Candidatus Liptonbacteria bacterium]|nr:tRNA (guanosine(37)-N1)-methyltransferase TrmD [Candidatus Liptonbacteria bacterium]